MKIICVYVASSTQAKYKNMETYISCSIYVHCAYKDARQKNMLRNIPYFNHETHRLPILQRTTDTCGT